MKEVYVVNCCRTAIGSFGGSLKDTPAAEMGATVIKEALSRAGVKPEQVDEVMFGHPRRRDGRHRDQGGSEPRRREA